MSFNSRSLNWSFDCIFNTIFKDKNGRTALHLAATNSRYLRLRRQISISPVYIDETELMRRKGSELELVSNRSAKCCEILLNHEADLCLRDNHVSFKEVFKIF